MKARGDILKEKDDLKDYLAHIQWDWWFLKAQLILILFIVAGIIFYLLWSF